MKKNLLETALCLTFFVIYLIRTLRGEADIERFFIWAIPQIVLCYTLHQFEDRHWLLKVLYYLSALVWIPLLFRCPEPDFWNVAATYLLAGIALLIGTERMDNERFGRHLLRVGIQLVEGGLVSLLLWGILCAVFATVNALFELSLGEIWYGHFLVFVLLLVLPLLCIRLLQGNANLSLVEDLLRMMVDRVLSAALVVYAAILYGYILRILIRWELPDGGVAYMVLLFLGVALACYLLRLQLEKRHFEWFYKAFPAIAVAPLGLLWTGIFRRIGEYGITEARFYLLVVAVLVTLFVAMLVCERFRRFQLMALMLAVAAVIFTYIPGIRARDFGRRSQERRAEKELFLNNSYLRPD